MYSVNTQERLAYQRHEQDLQQAHQAALSKLAMSARSTNRSPRSSQSEHTPNGWSRAKRALVNVAVVLLSTWIH